MVETLFLVIKTDGSEDFWLPADERKIVWDVDEDCGKRGDTGSFIHLNRPRCSSSIPPFPLIRDHDTSHLKLGLLHQALTRENLGMHVPSAGLGRVIGSVLPVDPSGFMSNWRHVQHVKDFH